MITVITVFIHWVHTKNKLVTNCKCLIISSGSKWLFHFQCLDSCLGILWDSFAANFGKACSLSKIDYTNSYKTVVFTSLCFIVDYFTLIRNCHRVYIINIIYIIIKAKRLEYVEMRTPHESSWTPLLWEPCPKDSPMGTPVPETPHWEP